MVDSVLVTHLWPNLSTADGSRQVRLLSTAEGTAERSRINFTADEGFICCFILAKVNNRIGYTFQIRTSF